MLTASELYRLNRVYGSLRMAIQFLCSCPKNWLLLTEAWCRGNIFAYSIWQPCYIKDYWRREGFLTFMSLSIMIILYRIDIFPTFWLKYCVWNHTKPYVRFYCKEKCDFSAWCCPFSEIITSKCKSLQRLKIPAVMPKDLFCQFSGNESLCFVFWS